VDGLDRVDRLKNSLAQAGVADFGLLSSERLRAATAGLDGPTRERCGLDEAPDARGAAVARGAVAAALGYGEGPSEAPEWARGLSGPVARIGRFARANWYAELSARLARAAELFRESSRASGYDPGPTKAWRRFVNSALPEKRLAVEAGMGEIGRNCLLLRPGRGSAVVLGVLLVPFDLPDSIPPDAKPGTPPGPRSELNAPRLSAFCEKCGACLAVCPTGALRGDGSLDRRLCLQHWSSVPGDVPAAVEAAWGDLLYGCDLCQEACPHFRPDPSARTDRGLLGPGLPAPWLDSASDCEIRAALKGSALGMSWISVSALKRSARHLTRLARLSTMEGNGGRNGR
jgi:epoxyqueuosine reductase QueG